MRLLLFISTIICCSNVCLGQQLPNASFEYWENKGEKVEPAGWNSLMSADMCLFCSVGASQRVFVQKRGLPGKGQCVRIESTSAIGGVIVNGSITTGRVTAPSIRPSEGFNRTVTGNNEFSFKFSSKPDSLVFWARYSITDESDSALASFILHSDSEMTDPPKFAKPSKPIGIARRTFQTDYEWKRISIPFEYSASNKNLPVYLLATFSSSFKAGKGNATATLWIDEVELIYNSLTSNQDMGAVRY